MTWTAAEAQRALEQAGLEPERFDLEAIASDLEERSALNASLDALVVGASGLDPVSRFDPRWT